MLSIRKRIQTLERFQSLRGGTAIDQTVRRALACVSDADLHLLESAAATLAQGRELTSAECAAAEAYASRSGAGIGQREITGYARQDFVMLMCLLFAPLWEHMRGGWYCR